MRTLARKDNNSQQTQRECVYSTYTTSDRVQYPQCQCGILHIPRHIHPLWGYGWNAPAVKLWFHHIPLDFLSHRDWITTVINKVIPICSIPQSFFEWPEKKGNRQWLSERERKKNGQFFFFHRFHRGKLLYTHSGSRWTLWSIYWWTHLFLFLMYQSITFYLSLGK